MNYQVLYHSLSPKVLQQICRMSCLLKFLRFQFLVFQNRTLQSPSFSGIVVIIIIYSKMRIAQEPFLGLWARIYSNYLEYNSTISISSTGTSICSRVGNSFTVPCNFSASTSNHSGTILPPATSMISFIL